MRRIVIIFSLILLTAVISDHASAFDGFNLKKTDCPPTHRHPVGAPLDGGVLALLAAAGISYFAFRKKKVKS